MRTNRRIATVSSVPHTIVPGLARNRRAGVLRSSTRYHAKESGVDGAKSASYKTHKGTYIVHGTAKALRLVLESKNYRKGIEAAISFLGEMLGVSRALIFRSLPSDHPTLFDQSLKFSWSDSEQSPQIAGSKSTLTSSVQMLHRWHELLSHGNTIHGSVRSLPATEQEYLHHGRTLSVLVIPIFMQDNYWGFAELDSCHEERVWTDAEIAALGAAAECIGSATARVLEEQRLRRLSERLETARLNAEATSTAKSQFLATMSHEIRTPMGGILGMTELALGTQLSVEQRNYIQTAKNSAENLLHILNDVLDFSKIEARRLDFEQSPFRLRDTIGMTLKTYAVPAFQKGLELTCHIDPSIPACLTGDSHRLMQVLSNLISNALKFTQAGEVGVSVDLVSWTEGNIELHFAVRDTGMGIDAKELENIFNPFCQGNRTTARLFGGTGLGLSISSGLVSMMRGRLEVTSTIGVGSSFHFVLPFTPGSLPVDNEWKDAELALAGKRAIVTCSNTTTLAAILSMLRDWGMETQVALDAQQILTELRNGRDSGAPHDLLLIDVATPGTTRCVQTIRQTPGFENLSVVALTRNAKEADDRALLEAGVTATLNKPIVSPDLLAVLRRARPRVATLNDEPVDDLAEAFRPATRRLRILLAEDHPVNQLLAVELLKRMGHVVTLARNGLEALEIYKAGTFDIVLLDIQMPELDGFGAAGMIRDFDGERGVRTPIVALTAHAMEGYREQCLAAGMDAYVTKPINTAELRQAIERLTASSPEPVRAVSGVEPATASENHQILDRARLLEQCGGSEHLVNRLIGKFLETASGHIQKIREALAQDDPEALWKSAHTLKGAAGSICAGRLAEHLRHLEVSGKERHLDEALQLSILVNEDLASLEAATKDLAERKEVS